MREILQRYPGERPQAPLRHHRTLQLKRHQQDITTPLHLMNRVVTQHQGFAHCGRGHPADYLPGCRATVIKISIKFREPGVVLDLVSRCKYLRNILREPETPRRNLRYLVGRVDYLLQGFVIMPLKGSYSIRVVQQLEALMLSPGG